MWEEGDSCPNDNVHCVSEWMELGREGGWHLRGQLRGYREHKVIRVGLGYSICVGGVHGANCIHTNKEASAGLTAFSSTPNTPLKLPPEGYMSLPIEKQ